MECSYESESSEGNLSCEQVVEDSPSQNSGTHENKKKKKSKSSGQKNIVEATECSYENESSEGNLSCEQVVKDSPAQNSGTHENKKKKKSKPSGQKNIEEGIKKLSQTKYLPLYGAALVGDWDRAKEFFDNDRDAGTAEITDDNETALHIAVSGGKTKKFVKELVTKYPASLQQVDCMNNTALFYAAAVGNTEVARFLVEKDLSLAQKQSKYGRYTPLHMAARNGHKDTVDFLLSKTIKKCPDIFYVGERVWEKNGEKVKVMDNSGLHLLKNLITASLTGRALDVLNNYPDLALIEELQSFALESLAQKPWLFESGTQLVCWKRLIYQWIEIPEKEHLTACPKGGDIENSNDSPKDCSATSKTTFDVMRGKVRVMFWNTIKQLVPSICETKIMHAQTLELVKLMCAKAKRTFSQETPPKFLEKPLFTAIELGIHELVKEIIWTYPPSAFFLDKVKRNIFQLAVLYRQEKVFSLIYEMGLYKHGIDFKDNQGNNILHLVGKLQPSSQVSGAALQMQKELQWFKAVETLVPPKSHKEKPKPSELCKELTPRQLFTEEHAKLAKEGEKWMKDIASSCSVVAALIVTMVFAAAFTAPGGYNSEGKPNFLREPAFIIFSIADALALFFSTTSVLIFLGILTSRYSEEDFLESLPRKLIFSLITLFMSIASMVVAFGAALHLVFVDIFKLVYIPIAVLAVLPVTLFAWLQFPLLVVIIRSTYGCGILRAVTRAKTKCFFACCKKLNLTFCCKDV